MHISPFDDLCNEQAIKRPHMEAREVRDASIHLVRDIAEPIEKEKGKAQSNEIAINELLNVSK